MTHNNDMPKRNVIKQYADHSFYHIYSRGVAKQPVFKDGEDYEVFLNLCKRYLSKLEAKNPTRHSYPNYSQTIQLLCYSLMPNHFHLLVYQSDENDAITKFMRSLLTSYSMFFNKKYQRVGPVFQSRYLASLIDSDQYLAHISRYIHLNPPDWQKNTYSSIAYYYGKKQSDWVKSRQILDLFDNNPKKYMDFLHDYKDHKKILDELKWELANS